MSFTEYVIAMYSSFELASEIDLWVRGDRMIGLRQNVSRLPDVDRLSSLVGGVRGIGNGLHLVGNISPERDPELPCALHVGGHLLDLFSVRSYGIMSTVRDFPDSV